jgi:hypothetical protein
MQYIFSTHQILEEGTTVPIEYVSMLYIVIFIFLSYLKSELHLGI